MSENVSIARYGASYKKNKTKNISLRFCKSLYERYINKQKSRYVTGRHCKMSAIFCFTHLTVCENNTI